MKRISIILQIILVCTLVFGCSEKTENGANKVEDNKYIKELPGQIKEGEYIICMNNMDLEINTSTMMAEIPFHILSSEELTLSDVEVNIDTDIPYEVALLESTYNEGKFAEYICLQYNGFDWKRFRELEYSVEEKEIQEYMEIKEAVEREYNALSEKDFPCFYDNSYVIRFDTFEQEYERQTIETIDISVKGNANTIDVGNVYLGITAKDINVGEYQLYFVSGGRAYYNILQDATGTISAKSFEMEVKDNVIIKNIYLLNESDTIEITEATIDIISGEGSYNLEWEKGKDISLDKGSQVYLNFDVCDKKFQGQQAYSVNIYVNVEYEVAGEIYETRTQVLCGSRYDGQTLYAIYGDMLDMSEYYEDYLK